MTETPGNEEPLRKTHPSRHQWSNVTLPRLSLAQTLEASFELRVFSWGLTRSSVRMCHTLAEPGKDMF